MKTNMDYYYLLEYPKDEIIDNVYYQIKLIKEDPQIIAYDAHDVFKIEAFENNKNELISHLKNLIRDRFNNSYGTSIRLTTFMLSLCKKLLKNDIIWDEVASYGLQLQFYTIYDIELYVQYVYLHKTYGTEFQKSELLSQIDSNLYTNFKFAKFQFDAIDLILKRRNLIWEEFEERRILFLLQNS